MKSVTQLVLIVAVSCLVAGSALAQTQPQLQQNKSLKVTPKSDSIDSKSELGEEEQLRLQMQTERRKKAQETQSNIIKKQSETDSTIIQNMK